MAPPAVVEGGEGEGGQGRQQRQAGGFGQSITGIIRIAVFWYFASKFFSPKKTTEPSVLISNLFQKAEPLVPQRSLSLYASLLSVFTYMYAMIRIL